MGRIREATQIELPTSGHLVSHTAEEVRAQLCNLDTSHVLVLDDTSFSGTTSLLTEELLRKAFPDREIRFTHGFLIINTGKLGPNEGAKKQLQQNGSQAIGGMEMVTPRDDGWHFFDLVNQKNIEDHLVVVQAMLELLQSPVLNRLAAAFLSDEQVLHAMFPELLSADELSDLQRTGRFITRKEITGGFHVHNPQLLPTIIGQNHVLKPEEWRASQKDVFSLLVHINQLLRKGTL